MRLNFCPQKCLLTLKNSQKSVCPHHENLNQKKNTTSNEAQFLPSEMPVDPQKFSKIRYKLNIPVFPHISPIFFFPPAAESPILPSGLAREISPCASALGGPEVRISCAIHTYPTKVCRWCVLTFTYLYTYVYMYM